MSPSTEAIVSTSMVFYAAGVAVGIAEALAYEGKHELACARHAAGAAAHRGLTAAQETTEDLALSLIHQIYVTFGACAGLYAGSKYAISTLKVWLLDDEISLQLVNAAPSPVKYSFPSDFRFSSRAMSRVSGNSSSSRCSSRSSSRSPRAGIYDKFEMPRANPTF